MRLSGRALSPRERQIVALAVVGRGDKEIARELCISAHTVKNHLTSVYRRLGLTGLGNARVLLAVWYLRECAEVRGERAMEDGKLYGRYTITHKDGEPIDPDRRYFVLSPDTDPAARAALVAYADAVEATHPILAGSIREEYEIAPADGGRVEGCARHLLAVMAEFPDDPSCFGEYADALERALEHREPVRYEQEW